MLGRTRLRFDPAGDDIEVPVSERDTFGRMVGTSTAMRATFVMLERATTSDATVLLQGETGTGKDLAAESIHAESARQSGPFLAVDCGALPANLIESELFGHSRGAFTGADRDHAGAFEQAHGGTLFLDEIGELPLELQPKLLRVLETRVVKRLGDSREIPVDVRVIAATNRDLQVEVNARRFRSDLYYRLAVLVIPLPSLRERRQDIEVIAQHLVERMDPEGGAEVVERLGGASFFHELTRHQWPGNVRELRNYIERCLAFERPLPFWEPDEDLLPAIDIKRPLRMARRQWVDYFERRYLEEILKEHGDNVTRASRAAGVDRAHFHRLLVKARLR
jgi:transcriptional regulator with PAS, ATPase and Fis domain